MAYRPPPWRMRGRALALWYRLVDPDEARRHVPRGVEMEADPVVRARFWDLQHDAAGPTFDADRPEGSTWTPIREAVVAFPVRAGTVEGDLPTYMYADDFIYTAMGREVMGWPVRDAVLEVTDEPAEGPRRGMSLSGRMIRGGREVMRASITLSGDVERQTQPPPPRWLAEKVIPRVDRPGAALAQLVATGPREIERRDVWSATGALSFGSSPGDELASLAPREIVRAEYWAGLVLTIGWGEVLADLGDTVYERG